MLPSEAVKQGICPFCFGRKVMGANVMCLHDAPLCEAGLPCCLCEGTGNWPPPDSVPEDGPNCYRAGLGFMVHGPGCTCSND